MGRLEWAFAAVFLCSLGVAAHMLSLTHKRDFLPVLVLFALLFVPLATAFALHVRSKRRNAARNDRLSRGDCLSCGYSLAGNLSGVCPECGAPVRRQSEGVSGKSADPPSPDLPISELLERAERIKVASDDLVRQMKELASQVAEVSALAENQRRKPEG